VSRKTPNEPDAANGSSRDSRIDVTVELLLPIVHTLLRGGMAFADFLNAAKLAYVNAAVRDSASTAKRPNASRIAALTGLTRREIKSLLALRGAHVSGRSTQGAAQPLSRIVEAWRRDQAFSTKSGKARVLQMLGPMRTFESLVISYGGDITVVAALKELERIGCVRRIGTDRVRLVRNNVELQGYNREAISKYGRTLNDFAEVLSSKLQKGDRDSFAEFKESTEVPLELASMFRKTFSERAQMLLDGFDTWTKRHSSKTSGPNHRIGIGIYIVEADLKRQK
jgi:Family of unknown function (DUF6502)